MAKGRLQDILSGLILESNQTLSNETKCQIRFFSPSLKRRFNEPEFWIVACVTDCPTDDSRDPDEASQGDLEADAGGLARDGRHQPDRMLETPGPARHRPEGHPGLWQPSREGPDHVEGDELPLSCK